MKTITVFLAIIGAATTSFTQGVLNFANTSSTLISAGGMPMPVSGNQQFIFALFLAPSTTVDVAGFTPSLTDPNFQFTEVYNTNNASLAGRLVTRADLPVGFSQGYFPGSTVDLIVRGWSANAGATWGEALANWNNGTPLVPMYIGSSTVGNNFVLAGGALPSPTIFGFAQYQILGFDMAVVPEPSVLVLAVLGGAALWANVRRRKREPT